MAARALTRLTFAVLSMLALSVFVFFLARLTGDPLNLLLPESATLADFAAVRQQLGLDQPLLQQYTIFLTHLLQGDLGTSIVMRTPVAVLIGQRFLATLALAVAALILVLGVGLPLGIYSAYWRGGRLDRVARTFAALGQSAPAFWVGLLLILVFAVRLRWLPSGGTGGIQNLVLPAITMSLGATAAVTRLMRSSMIEVLDSDFVKFLRIKGVPERTILWKHASRSAGLSTMTFIGVVTAHLITGSVVTETVFLWPGMGQLMVQSIENRDFPVTQAIVLVFALIYLVVNLVVDMLYAVLDPRLR